MVTVLQFAILLVTMVCILIKLQVLHYQVEQLNNQPASYYLTTATQYKTTITGDNSTTNFAVTHNLNTRDVSVEVYHNGSPYETTFVTIQRTTVNVVDVIFNTAPTGSESYNVLIRSY